MTTQNETPEMTALMERVRKAVHKELFRNTSDDLLLERLIHTAIATLEPHIEAQVAARLAADRADALDAAREAGGREGWQLLTPDRTVHPWEAGIIQLWHPLWDRGVTAGYYNAETDQWCGLDSDGWFALGIPPSHWRQFASPPNSALLPPAPDAPPMESGHG